jgi:hypothetical protein
LFSLRVSYLKGRRTGRGLKVVSAVRLFRFTMSNKWHLFNKRYTQNRKHNHSINLNHFTILPEPHAVLALLFSICRLHSMTNWWHPSHKRSTCFQYSAILFYYFFHLSYVTA